MYIYIYQRYISLSIFIYLYVYISLSIYLVINTQRSSKRVQIFQKQVIYIYNITLDILHKIYTIGLFLELNKPYPIR